MTLTNITPFRQIHAWDVNTFKRWQVRACRASITSVARKISMSADGWPYVLFAATYYLLDPIIGGVFATALFWALLVERSCYFIMKKSFKRRRPPAAIPNFQSAIKAADEFSFPSGHTSGAFLFVTTCVLVFGPAMIIAYIWAGMVALSRISLGVHFPTDTVMGAILGTSLAVLSYSHFVI